MLNDQTILIICADGPVLRKARDTLNRIGCRRLQIADSIEEARTELRMIEPAVILLDESVIPEANNGSFSEFAVRELTITAPVVLTAAYARLPEMSVLVAAGVVDFVARTGEFLEVAARLVGRRLGLQHSEIALPHSLRANKGDDFGELLRHEVNNPLTGILGNTELLLARPEQLPPGAIERLQTIADLAVRLREIVRHLSNTWEANHQPVGPM